MADLATTQDLEQHLGRDLTADEAARAGSLLADVSGSIRLYTGQQFARDTYTVRRRVKRGRVRLSQRPVHEVESVKDRWDNDIDHEWDGLDRVYVRCCGGRAPVQVVDVAYEAGPDEVPESIVGLTCSIVLRNLGRTPTDGAVLSESIDEYTYRLASAAGAGSYGLLPEEQDTLDHFKGASKIGNIQVAW